jgi:hypothetical protein
MIHPLMNDQPIIGDIDNPYVLMTKDEKADRMPLRTPRANGKRARTVWRVSKTPNAEPGKVFYLSHTRRGQVPQPGNPENAEGETSFLR